MRSLRLPVLQSIACSLLLQACAAPQPSTSLPVPSRSSCPSDDPHAVASLRVFPGTYAISMEQFEGSESAPTVVHGVIHLACYPNHWSRLGAYGWIELDFSKLRAPIGRSSRILAPDSNDPDAPGVEVSPIGSRTVLFIGSLANIKPRTYVDPKTGGVYSEAFKDGAGIALTVEVSEPDHFAGIWDNAGIYASGWGSFSARLVADAPAAR